MKSILNIASLILIFIFICRFAAGLTYAKYDPLSVPNNRFGIHVADMNDIGEAAKLVNSSGGDWGYVTFVIAETDRKRDSWQQIFNELRRQHLIPIVRLATRVENSVWTIPGESAAGQWTDFLSSLNWPTENRYVVIFNEPNHSKEWGGKVDPEGYARIFTDIAESLKKSSEDFFILPAALDMSAASDASSMDAVSFLERALSERPQIISLLDGWNSHSYPNPGFSGSPGARGRGTIAGFDWELSHLEQLGLDRDLPVFITETGWEHSEGLVRNPKLLPPVRIGEYIRNAATGIWRDPRIVMLSPFLLNYQDSPFDHFSWRKPGAAGYYEHFDAYQSLEKSVGKPQQRESYELEQDFLPDLLVAGSKYVLSSQITNHGQAIVDMEDGYSIGIADPNNDIILASVSMPQIEPGEQRIAVGRILTGAVIGARMVRVGIVHDNRLTALEEKIVNVVPPPSAALRIMLGWTEPSRTFSADVNVYDTDKRLIGAYNSIPVTAGQIRIDRLTDIIPGNTYGIEVRIPGYLLSVKRQILTRDNTLVEMPRMLPIDFDLNGSFGAGDILEAIRQPRDAVRVFTGS
ncbi:hypothetical protein A2Z33_00880 [Candidatus Gottesmanbacteria bacterium RBG_16_52_11]|uniref:Glycoside hydrolase family 5 domain-containing protein n=1 Tax=Candidatus Gottesmanbacteria bacterium RBG_16_52_11 TaxID=1798374 RepID=A0A1F5YP27_9BACT|nr:MAG: hypothetical protein A2Z33_00880 [Candidatus Gottesmanbacteria bacterium RBG_16_52_11]